MESVGEPVAVCTLRAHRGEVTCADESGAWLATGGGDGELRLWRWRPGIGWEDSASEPRAHRYGVTTVRWAPTGVLLASAGVDGAARIWAMRTLKPRRALVAPHAAAARAACWATSERLLVGHDDGAVRVWCVRDSTLLACVHPLQGAVHALTAFSGASLLLAACTEGVLKIFDLEEVCRGGTERGSGPAPLLWEDGAHDLGALCAAGSACGRAAATGGHDARVRVWHAREDGVAAGDMLSGHSGAVTALRWARDAALLVSASLDRTARVWAVAAGACLRVLPAHSRYLTCVAVPQNARYLVTGSNDKTIRTWSLCSFSIEDDLEPECSPLVHFGLGDLKGIGPVNDDLLVDEDGDAESNASGEFETPAYATTPCATPACAGRTQDPRGGAVNCVATYGARLAAACSDGAVRIFCWCEGDAELRLERTLDAHLYPVLSVDFSASGALLVSAGLDGCARLWDVESGCEIASLWAAGRAGGVEGESGGGVRGARVSPHRPPLLLLATDAGAAALWAIDGTGCDPVHVYPEAGGGAACTCVAWAGDGRAAAVGGAGGALQLLVPPPVAAELCRLPDAHDLGVSSCDFALETIPEDDDDVRSYLLASGGMDESVKLWAVEVRSDGRGALHLRGALAAHGGAVHSVRWGTHRALATAGADRWARVWRVTADHCLHNVHAVQVAAVPAGSAGGAAAAFLQPSALAVGAIGGRLAVWRLPEPLQRRNEAESQDVEIGVEPRWWGVEGVLRWLQEYVTRIPGARTAGDAQGKEEKRLEAATRAGALSGARLLDEPLEQLLDFFGCSREATNESVSEASGETTTEAEYEAEDVAEDEAGEAADEAAVVRARLLEELLWLRRPPLSFEEEARVPHELLCALSHVTPRQPVRASDGYTYERAVLAHWHVIAGPVSPMSGRRLRGKAAPNRGVLSALRQHFASTPAQEQ